MRDCLVIALNGMARSGKDTLADHTKLVYNKRCNDLYDIPSNKVDNFSSIDSVREVLTGLGWDGVKDEKSRAALSEFKDAWTKWNDGPFNQIVERINKSDKDIIFCHIREPKEIEKLKNHCNDNSIFFESILVVRPSVETISSNTGDLGSQEPYPYTQVVHNSRTIEEYQKTIEEIVDEWIVEYELL